jgi:hypothetical protein
MEVGPSSQTMEKGHLPSTDFMVHAWCRLALRCVTEFSCTQNQINQLKFKKTTTFDRVNLFPCPFRAVPWKVLDYSKKLKEKGNYCI